jgi:hypothetical protein
MIMGNIQVKGGTPRHGDTLCRTCSFAHIVKGFSASQELFYCEQIHPNRPIPFAVCECSMYEDKRVTGKREMEEIAWLLTTRKPGRSVGFISPAKFHELELETTQGSPVGNKADESTE